MNNFTELELKTAYNSISSTLKKTNKVFQTLSNKDKPPVAQIKTVAKDIKNFSVMQILIERELNHSTEFNITAQDLEELYKYIPNYINRIEKVQSMFKQGTPQYTLAARRIESYLIILSIIKDEIKTEK